MRINLRTERGWTLISDYICETDKQDSLFFYCLPLCFHVCKRHDWVWALSFNRGKDQQCLLIKVAQTKLTRPDLQMVFIRSILSWAQTSTGRWTQSAIITSPFHPTPTHTYTLFSVLTVLHWLTHWTAPGKLLLRCFIPEWECCHVWLNNAMFQLV